MADASGPKPQERFGMPDTVLVTGGAGFLGAHVVERLSTSVGRVIAVDVTTTPAIRALTQQPNVEFHVLDLRDADRVEPLVARADAIVHLAAMRTRAAQARPRDAHDVNVGVTYDLLASATRHSVGRFVFSSTNTVYGSYQDPHASSFREDRSPIGRGINMYAATKIAGEAYLEAFRSEGGPEYLALRIGSVYGPRVTPDSNASTILAVLRALDRGERPTVPWSRDSVLALVHVEDVVRAVVASLTATRINLAVNVVGELATAERIYSTLVRLYGHDPALLDFTGERRRYQYVSNDLMREVLGLVPEITLGRGLRSLITWYRDEERGTP